MEWTRQLPIHEADTFGHMIRYRLITNNKNVDTTFVQTKDTLNKDTDGSITIRMVPNSTQRPQEAYVQAINQIIQELECLEREIKQH